MTGAAAFLFTDILILLISCSGLTMLIFQLDFLFSKNFQERKNQYSELNTNLLKILTALYLVVNLIRIFSGCYEMFRADKSYSGEIDHSAIFNPTNDLYSFWLGFLLVAILPILLWLKKVPKKKFILITIALASTFYFWMPLMIKFTTSSSLEALEFQFSNRMLYADVGIMYCLWIPIYWEILFVVDFVS
jgi:hypothetical protein